MKFSIITALMVIGFGAFSPSVSFAEDDGMGSSCAEDWECQNSKIDAEVARQEQEDADRKIAQDLPSPPPPPAKSREPASKE